MPIARRRRVLAAGSGLIAGAALLTTVGASAGTSPALAAARQAATARAAPVIKLIAAQREIVTYRFGKQEYIDPGIWVASLHAALQLNVGRASYTKPVTVTQVIKTPDGVVRRPLPARIRGGWNGLRRFARVVVTSSTGRIVARRNLTFCPGGGQLAKENAGAAATSHYPMQCAPFDPFPIGEVWGLPRGWASEPFEGFGPGFRPFELKLGTYRFTVTISRLYVRLFHVTRPDRTASVRVKIQKLPAPPPPTKAVHRPSSLAPVPANFLRIATAKPAARSQSRFPAARTLSHPPASAEPDLVPLPSWSIVPVHQKRGDDDYLDFAATVWIGGNGPLDVEGFRTNQSGTMQAWQYFYRHGKLIGKTRVGTMGFAEYNAWHFKQFAEYRLLNARKKIVIRSRKVGFCIAPTDSVDMLLRHAVWQPSYTGISGNCGDPSALWVTETLPLGWGDTYVQTVPYQNFEITDLPNGTYYIEIIANPEHLLYETNTHNDVSLRKIIIGGTRGHRTVRVPAWHGLDPENGKGSSFFF